MIQVGFVTGTAIAVSVERCVCYVSAALQSTENNTPSNRKFIIINCIAYIRFPCYSNTLSFCIQPDKMRTFSFDIYLNVVDNDDAYMAHSKLNYALDKLLSMTMIFDYYYRNYIKEAFGVSGTKITQFPCKKEGSRTLSLYTRPYGCILLVYHRKVQALGRCAFLPQFAYGDCGFAGTLKISNYLLAFRGEIVYFAIQSKQYDGFHDTEFEYLGRIATFN